MASPEDYNDEDGDGFLPDWNEAPIHYSCQKNHIIVFTNSRPSGDANLFSTEFYPDLSTIHSNSPSMVDIAWIHRVHLQQMLNVSSTKRLGMHTINMMRVAISVENKCYNTRHRY